jgi:hypothetical protein
MRMTAYWDTVLCNQVEVYRRFGGAYCIHHQECEYAARGKLSRKVGTVRIILYLFTALIKEAVNASETSIHF